MIPVASTRKRAKSGAIIAALGAICGLKGPQGLLFGRNAGAGTIHLITAKPDPERTGGYAHAGAGERGVIEFDGAINLPLSDNAALRIAAFHAEEGGWIENLQGGSDRGGNDNTGGRASIGFVGERASVTAMVEYEQRQTSGTLYALVDPVSGDPYSGDVWAIDSEILDTDTDESDLLSLTLMIEYDLGFATFSSITGFKDHEFYYFEDVDGVPDQYINYVQDQSGDYLSQEPRLVSETAAISPGLSARAPTGEDINADFSSASDEETTCFYTFGDSCAAIYPYFYGFEWPGGTADGLVRESGVGQGEYNGWALYGEATYRLTEQFDVSLGLRYSYDKKKYTMDAPFGDSYLSPAILLGFYLPHELEDSENWDDTSPRAVLRYRPNEDLTLYASFTKGFKSGGYDSFAVTGLDPYTFEVTPGVTMLNPFEPETIYSYEAGLKALLFDRTTQIDIAAFYYDYQDLQLGTFKGTLFEVDNVGEVQGYGVEAQLQSRPNRYVEFNLGIALSDTEADDVSLDTCSRFDFVTDCNGNRLPSQPGETVHAGLTLYYPVDPGEVFLAAEYIYMRPLVQRPEQRRRPAAAELHRSERPRRVFTGELDAVGLHRERLRRAVVWGRPPTYTGTVPSRSRFCRTGREPSACGCSMSSEAAMSCTPALIPGTEFVPRGSVPRRAGVGTFEE